ncbi:MAG: PKD domain-containing protein [Myxococcales bacterium]|nr:PKD domain-containing protein [Myxococcales bacterium]
MESYSLRTLLLFALVACGFGFGAAGPRVPGRHTALASSSARLALLVHAVVGGLLVNAIGLGHVDGALGPERLGVWVSAGELFVDLSFQLESPWALGAYLVWMLTSAAAWRWRHDRTGALGWVLAAQLAALAGVFAEGFVVAAAAALSTAWAVEGVAATRGAASSPARALANRGCDLLLLLVAVLVVAFDATEGWASLAARLQDESSGLLTPVLGLAVADWALGLLLLAAFVRGTRPAGAMPRGLALLAASGVELLATALLPLRAAFLWRGHEGGVRGVAALAVGVGLLVGWRVTVSLRWRRVTRAAWAFGVALGRAVRALEVWVLRGLVFQTLGALAELASRVLRFWLSGNVQRYVAFGVLGLAAAVYAASRPAAAPVLQIHTEGLRVRADAGRSAASAARLTFDYDFDGDDRIDRAGAGPRASHAYSSPGPYAVTVIVRDPFWGTATRLERDVWVGP